jgi:hypothetical protein
MLQPGCPFLPWLFAKGAKFMSNFEELLNGFATQQPDQWTFNPTHSQPKETPEDRDLQRLEGDIHSVFESRRLLNKAIATFCAVVGSSAGIHLFARLGIPAIASGTIGGIVIAVCLGNALTKIRIDQGRPTIDGEFSLALAQALGITGSMWFGSSEYRQLSNLASQGRTEFSTEVQNFELKPQSPDFGRLRLAGIGVALLIVAIAFLKGSNRNGY